MPAVLTLAAAVWGGVSRSALTWPPGYLGPTEHWVLTAAILLVGGAWSIAHGGGRLGLFGKPLDRVLLWAVLVLLALGLNWENYHLADTAVFGFVVAVEMMDTIPSRHRAVFDRLTRRGVLVLTPAEELAFFARLQRQVPRWSAAWGVLLAAAGPAAWAAWAVLNGKEPLYVLLHPFTLVTFFCGFIAGESLGRMLAYGASWWFAERNSARWRLVPGHFDRAGGFKPIGDFFFYESVIVGIPAIYLAVWLVIFQWIHVANWTDVYLILLGFAILLEVVAFFLPMYSIHDVMQNRKTRLLAQADELSRTIEVLQHRLCDQQFTSQHQQLNDYVADLTEECKRIEQVPSWPIDPSIRRRFSLGQLALLLPFIEFIMRSSIASVLKLRRSTSAIAAMRVR